MSSESAPPTRGAWKPARQLAQAVLAPVQRFLAIEAASGIVLIAAAAGALVLANSPLGAAWEGLWTTTPALSVGEASFARDLRWWVNDGLMTLFFFVVGLEIRREIHAGELSEVRRAALPVAAAVGGMLAPALLFLAFNHGHPSSVGWGVPMATDIAFAVGVLALLGDRVAPALRILLLALAVIDDLGAILVIALFYSHGLAPMGFVVAGAGVLGLVALRRFGVRSPWAYVPFGVVTWAGTYASGVHPTIAGVVIGLLTPVTPLPGEDTSPADRLITGLHGSVAYGVMPLFALANAGVPLGAASLDGDGWRVFVGVAVGLVVGKIVGVWGASRLVSAVGLATPPRGVTWRDVSVVGAVAGIGFTMALFIAQLAFPPGPMLETAKLAILAASAVAGVGGYAWGRLALRRAPGGAATEAEAEASTAL